MILHIEQTSISTHVYSFFSKNNPMSMYTDTVFFSKNSLQCDNTQYYIKQIRILMYTDTVFFSKNSLQCDDNTSNKYGYRCTKIQFFFQKIISYVMIFNHYKHTACVQMKVFFFFDKKILFKYDTI